MTQCSECMLSYPCRAIQGQSLMACHPVQPSWQLPPAPRCVGSIGKQTRRLFLAGLGTCPAPGVESGFTFPVLSCRWREGRGRGGRGGTVAEKDTMGLQGPAGSGGLLGGQLSPKRQNLASQAAVGQGVDSPPLLTNACSLEDSSWDSDWHPAYPKQCLLCRS